MTVVYGTLYGTGSAGWSQVTQDNVADKIWYVAASPAGNDSYDGTAPSFTGGTTGPKATLLAGQNLLRDGTGDWLLVRCGDTFTDQTFGAVNKSGRDAQHPLLFSNYGTGARPIIAYSSPQPSTDGAGSPIYVGQGYISNNLAFIGLDFYGYRGDPNVPANFNPDLAGAFAFDIHGVGNFDSGLGRVGSANNWLIEDCLMRYLYAGISFDKGGSTAQNPTGWVVRRCVFRDLLYALGSGFTTSQAEGFYAGNHDNLRLEECIFHHIGWSEVPYATGTPIITAGTPAVVAWNGLNLHLQNGAPLKLTGSFPSGIVAGQPYAVANISGTQPNFTFNLQHYSDGNLANATGTGSGMTIAWQGYRTYYSHANYIQGDNVTIPPSIQGNIYSMDCGPQHRSGGTSAGNFFFGFNTAAAWQLLNPIALHDYVTDNVFSEPDDDPAGAINGGHGLGISQNVAFVNNEGELNIGAGSWTTFQNNIFTHNHTYSGGWVCIELMEGCTASIIQNNIVWDWGATDSGGVIFADRNSGTINSYANLVGGSGYTPASGTQQYNNVLLTGGTPDTGISYDGIPKMGVVHASITVTNGSVTKVTNWPTTNDRMGGNGYSPGQTLSANASDIGGTGNGFHIDVATLCANTIATISSTPSGTNNVYHASNTADVPAYSDPTRSISSYVINVLGLTDAGSVQGNFYQFMNLANSNTKQTWDSRYTALGFNNYIRAGFNMAPLGPTGGLSISPAGLPNGTVGMAYNQTITASGGTAPYTWSSTGNIPPGLTFHPATATLDGTPTTTTGSPFTFTISVHDSAATQLTGSQSYTVSIAAATGPSVRFVYHKM